MRRLLFVFAFVGLASLAFAQSDVTVLQYNLTYYGNGLSSCTESNNNTTSKQQYIKTILNYVQPTIFTVNEFGNSQPLLNEFMSQVLNVNGVHKWKTTPIITNNTYTTIVNSIFYDSDKVELLRHRIAQTATRDIDAYELYFKTEGTLVGDTIKLVCMVAHLKAGYGSDNENKRSIMVQNALWFCENNYAGENVLFMGDFNLYGASEPAYQKMTSKTTYPHAAFIDPLGPSGVGEWNENSAYKQYHTQSTNLSGSACITGGGLDDRFDFIMMSQAIDTRDKGLEFSSFKVIGNDGNHFNKSINSPANNSVPSDVLNALVSNSDHLPVKMELRLSDRFIDVPEADEQQVLSIYPTPATDIVNIAFTAREAQRVEVDVYNIQGQLVQQTEVSADGGRQIESIDISNLEKGFYLVSVRTGAQTATSKMVVM